MKPFVTSSIYYALVSILFITYLSPKVFSQNIPDPNFAAAIRAVCPTCIDGANNLLPPAKALTSLDVSNKNISNLTGIGGFTALTQINCMQNQLTSLPTLPNTLLDLQCNNNLLTTLPSLPANLNRLICTDNQLTSLPSLPSNLIILNCDNNQLTSLPSLPNGLLDVWCHHNRLINLPTLPSNIISLICENNQLTILPELPSKLTTLICSNNNLTVLPTLPSGLTRLFCSFNKLTSLPSLPPNLPDLYCNSNQLTVLPTLPSSLTLLYCTDNQIASLPTLPLSLAKLHIDANKIKCLPNLVAGLQVYDSNTPIPTPPVCGTPTCPAPVATGADICLGTSVTLTATGCSGNGAVLKWYKSANDSLAVMPVAPNTTTNYYAKCEITTNGVTCVSPASNSVAVTVIYPPAPPVTTVGSISTVCVTNSMTLSATGCTGAGNTLRWFMTGTNTPVTMPITPTVPISSYYAKCELTVNGISCLSGESNNIIVLYTPELVATGATTCSGTPVTLAATGCSGNGAVLKWFRATDNVLVSMPVAPSTTTNYYAKCELTFNGITCISAASNTVTATVALAPATPVATGARVCPGSSVTLTATGCNGTGFSLNWYLGGNRVTMPVAPAVTTTGYYAKCELTTNGTTCTSSASNSVAITVTNPPSPENPSSATICAGSSVTLTASGCTGEGYALKWFSTNGNSPVTMPVTISASSLNIRSVSYYAKCQFTNNGVICLSGESNPAIVTVLSAPTPIATGATICKGSSVPLTATGCSGDGFVLKWFRVTDNIPVTMPVSPTANTDYYAKCELTTNSITCTSSPSNTVTVTVGNNTAPVASGATIVSGESVTLTATGCSGTGYALKWFKAADNTIVSMPVSPTTDTDYYAQCEENINDYVCISPVSNTVTVTLSNSNPKIVKKFYSFGGGGGGITDKYIYNYKNKVAFCAVDTPPKLADFWLSDGTAEGTKKIKVGVSFRKVKDNIVIFKNIGDNYYSVFGFDEITQDTFLLIKKVYGSPAWDIDGTIPKAALNLFFVEKPFSNNVIITDGTTKGTKTYIYENTKGFGFASDRAVVVGDQLTDSDGLRTTNIIIINDEGSRIIYSNKYDDPTSVIRAFDRGIISGSDLYAWGSITTNREVLSSGLYKNGNLTANKSQYEEISAKDFSFIKNVGGMVFQQTRKSIAPYDRYYLWVTKGSGVSKIKNTKEVGGFMPILFNNEAYFFARDENGTSGLWKTDGTNGGTVLISSSIYSQGNIGDAVIVNNLLYFIVSGNIWRSDGTQLGTYPVPELQNIGAYSMTSIGNTLYFISHNELWRFDLLKDISVQHYHQLPNNPLFTQRKLLKEGDTFKVCADGSEASIFKFSGGGYDYTKLKVELLGNPDNSPVEAHLYGQTIILSANADSLVIRYKHPNHISTSSEYSTGGFYLKNAETSTVIKQYTLQIYRPPVLLVHGLWSDASSFNKMANQLNGAPLYNAPYFIKNVNYNSTNYLPFAVNQFIVPSNIDQVFNTVINNGFAVGKVDIVGHSMGGILSRLYLQEATYRQDIHKLITLNTPHAGSQLANFYQSLTISDNSGVLCGFWEDPKLCDGGALDNLRVNSDAILQTLNGTAKNRNKVPSHTITTTVPSNLSQINLVPDALDVARCGAEIATLSLIAGIYGAVFAAGQCIREYAIEKATEAIVRLAADASLNTIFALEANDQVVALSSQRGGLTGLSTTLIENQSHSGAASNDQVISRVKELLIKEPNSDYFSKNGFEPPRLTSVFSSSPPVISRLAITNTASITINKPTRSTSYLRGSFLSLDITGININEMKIVIGHTTNTAYIIKHTGAQVKFNFPLDSILGKRKITVFGKTSDGRLVADSTSINVTDKICEHTSPTAYLYVTGNLPTGEYTFNNIVSDAKIEPLKDVTYQTTGYALFLPGFEAKGQSEFKTEIKACPTAPNPPPK